MKQLVIIGGGTSIKEGISKDLWKKMRNRFTFGLNYSFKYFPNPTAQLFVDDKFYIDEKQKMKNLSLIIGKKHKITKMPNTIMLQCKSKYIRNLKDGIYKSTLVGLFALSLGIYILEEGEIYLLGFDYSAQGKDKDGRDCTHFYQGDIKHRGIGKTNYYTADKRADRDFGVYKNEKKVKIYNISLNSKINIFPKISYDKFFSLLNNEQCNQNKLRQYIKEKLNGLA